MVFFNFLMEKFLKIGRVPTQTCSFYIYITTARQNSRDGGREKLLKSTEYTPNNKIIFYKNTHEGKVKFNTYNLMFSLITILTFLVTLIFILWRPKGINEAIPATIGALIVILCGAVSLSELGSIAEAISGAAITIMATIVMAIVLESFGF